MASFAAVILLMLCCPVVGFVGINSKLDIYGDRLSNLHYFEDRIYSQNGEDGILLSLLDIIGSKSHFYVEFGVGSGIECNTKILRERLNFTGKFSVST